MTVQIFCNFQNTKYETHWCFKTQKANKMSKKERQKATKSPPLTPTRGKRGEQKLGQSLT